MLRYVMSFSPQGSCTQTSTTTGAPNMQRVVARCFKYPEHTDAAWLLCMLAAVFLERVHCTVS
jgi:hypothetical protein